MAIVHDLVNVGACSQTGFNGTNNDFCVLDIKRIKKILRAKPGFKFATDFQFTLSNVNLLIQQGELIPIYTTVNSTFTTAENGVETFGGGDKSIIEKMPIELQAKVLNGVQGYQNTLTIEKAKVHSFLIVDKDNTIFGIKGKDGLFGGIKSNFFQVMPYVGAGDESAGYMIEWQLDRTQFDTQLVGLRDAEYDFDIDDLKGVTNVEITIPTAPVALDTTVTFKAVRLEDKVAQLGLDNTEIQISINGTPEATPTIVDNLDGTYTATITALAAADVVTVRIFDGTYAIADLGGVLIKSNTAETIVTA